MLGVLLFFTLVAFIPATLVIKYETDFIVYLRILFIKIRIAPGKVKKIRLKDYTPEGIEYRLRRLEKKKLKKEKKKKPSAVREKPKRKLSELPDYISKILDTVTKLCELLFDRLSLRAAKVEIRIGTDDSAKTAMLYGAAVAGVSTLCSVLDQFTLYRNIDNKNISIYADFTSQKTTAKFNLRFSLRVYQTITFAISAAPDILKLID